MSYTKENNRSTFHQPALRGYNEYVHPYAYKPVAVKTPVRQTVVSNYTATKPDAVTATDKVINNVPELTGA
jgi:hypothetical protein